MSFAALVIIFHSSVAEMAMPVFAFTMTLACTFSLTEANGGASTSTVYVSASTWRCSGGTGPISSGPSGRVGGSTTLGGGFEPHAARMARSIALLRILHLDGLDDGVHRSLDDLRVGIADDHIAVALVAVGLGCAGSGQSGLDDELADELVGALDAGDAHHAPAPRAAQERAADGPPAVVRSVERVVDDGARPRTVHVRVVRERVHAHDVG